jgi:hypothetical protein
VVSAFDFDVAGFCDGGGGGNAAACVADGRPGSAIVYGGNGSTGITIAACIIRGVMTMLLPEEQAVASVMSKVHRAVLRLVAMRELVLWHFSPS